MNILSTEPQTHLSKPGEKEAGEGGALRGFEILTLGMPLLDHHRNLT